MKYRANLIKEIHNILKYEHVSEVNKIIRKNKIDVYKLYSILTDPDAPNRRDEFYSMFKEEYATQADFVWERFMDEYYLPKYY